MNGPQHYAEAERLLNGDALDMAAAQVHATLALVAVTFSAGQYADQQNCSILNGPTWIEVIS